MKSPNKIDEKEWVLGDPFAGLEIELQVLQMQWRKKYQGFDDGVENMRA